MGNHRGSVFRIVSPATWISRANFPNPGNIFWQVGKGWGDTTRILLCTCYDSWNCTGIFCFDSRPERNFCQSAYSFAGGCKGYGITISQYALLLVFLFGKCSNVLFFIYIYRSCCGGVDYIPAIKCIAPGGRWI